MVVGKLVGYKKYFILITMLGLFSGPAQAVYPDYGLDMQAATWVTSSNHLKCVMEQDIPLYGKAEFIQAAGKSLRMRLTTIQPITQTSLANFESRPPAWNHVASKLDMGTVSLSKGTVPIKLQQSRSQRVIAELEKGMQPTLRFANVVEGRQRVEIAISPIRFQQALQEFRTCVTQLFPYGYDQLRSSRVYFQPNDYYLDERGKESLQRLARFIKLEKNVRLVTVNGYASTEGSRFENMTLSEKRANTVIEYLALLKVPSKLVKKRFYGDRKMVASNKTRKGRALNRRVEIKLEKPY